MQWARIHTMIGLNDRQLFWNANTCYGIRESTHKWSNSCSPQIVLDSQASYPVPVLSGVPQGLVLGLILFPIFINGLRITSGLLFADDCVLYRNIYSIQDCLTLQEDLTTLGPREADWQMKCNVAYVTL